MNFLSKPQQHLTPTKGLDWDNPLLTIECTVYNHENFLHQTLDGFIMQETTFPFHAIIHDDASTDNSAAIIEEYTKKYPHIFKPIYQKENQFSKKHAGSMWKDIAKSVAKSSKYIALCEGDDYWTKPYKLQKQVDFLEEHDEVTLYFHNALFHFGEGVTDRLVKDVDQNGKPKDYLAVENAEDRFYDFDEVFLTWYHATASWVLRKSVYSSDLYKKVVKIEGRNIDDKLRYTAAKLGKVYFSKEVMSVYRMHKDGVSQTWNTDIPPEMYAQTLYLIKVFHPNWHNRMKIYDNRAKDWSKFLIDYFKDNDRAKAKEVLAAMYKANAMFCIFATICMPYTIVKRLIKGKNNA